jgi:hypothetical protein
MTRCHSHTNAERRQKQQLSRGTTTNGDTALYATYVTFGYTRLSRRRSQTLSNLQKKKNKSSKQQQRMATTHQMTLPIHLGRVYHPVAIRYSTATWNFNLFLKMSGSQFQRIAAALVVIADTNTIYGRNGEDLLCFLMRIDPKSLIAAVCGKLGDVVPVLRRADYKTLRNVVTEIGQKRNWKLKRMDPFADPTEEKVYCDGLNSATLDKTAVDALASEIPKESMAAKDELQNDEVEQEAKELSAGAAMAKVSSVTVYEVEEGQEMKKQQEKALEDKSYQVERPELEGDKEQEQKVQEEKEDKEKDNKEKAEVVTEEGEIDHVDEKDVTKTQKPRLRERRWLLGAQFAEAGGYLFVESITDAKNRCVYQAGCVVSVRHRTAKHATTMTIVACAKAVKPHLILCNEAIAVGADLKLSDFAVPSIDSYVTLLSDKSSISPADLKLLLEKFISMKTVHVYPKRVAPVSSSNANIARVTLKKKQTNHKRGRVVKKKETVVEDDDDDNKEEDEDDDEEEEKAIPKRPMRRPKKKLAAATQVDANREGDALDVLRQQNRELQQKLLEIENAKLKEQLEKEHRDHHHHQYKRSRSSSRSPSPSRHHHSGVVIIKL